MQNQEHERERDQTHSYWYILSAPRVNYSLLVMENTGMMKMATGDGFPSGRVPERAPERFLVATEACGGGTPDLLCSLMFLGYMEIYRRKKYVRGATRGPRGWRASPGGVGAPPYLMASSFLSWRGLQVFSASSDPKISSVKFQVNWTPFDFPFLWNPKTR